MAPTSRINLDISPTQPSGWAVRFGLAGLFMAIAVGLYGVLSVDYRWSVVLDVQQVAGKDMSERVVLFEADGRTRLVRIADRLVQVRKGGLVCISKRRMIARRWARYGVALPGYCRSLPFPAGDQTVLNRD
jgi:hypothetical protein